MQKRHLYLIIRYRWCFYVNLSSANAHHTLKACAGSVPFPFRQLHGSAFAFETVKNVLKRGFLHIRAYKAALERKKRLFRQLMAEDFADTALRADNKCLVVGFSGI